MNKYIILIILAMGFSLFSCVDNTEDNLSEPKVYIVNGDRKMSTGVVLYNTGISDTLPLSIYRSGKNGVTANAKISMLTAAELSEYNLANKTDFSSLSSGFEFKNTEVNFRDGDAQNVENINIEYDPALLKGILEASPKQLVIPVTLDNSNLTINEKKNYAFVAPVIKDPLIYLGISGLSSNSYDEGKVPEEIKIDIPVKVDFKNVWSIACNLEIDAVGLEDYNTVNETYYALLPSEAYTLEKNLVIQNGKKTAKTELKVLGKSIPFGSYVLPIKIASVSKFGIDQTKNSYFVGISTLGPRLDREGWEIVYVSSEQAGEGASLILDGKLETFWHSNWSNSDPLPHSAVVDMKVEKTVTQVALNRRKNNSDTKTVEFYISSDNVNWKKIGKGEVETKDDEQIFGVLATKGRYLKLVVTESRRAPFSGIAEFNVFGF